MSTSFFPFQECMGDTPKNARRSRVDEKTRHSVAHNKLSSYIKCAEPLGEAVRPSPKKGKTFYLMYLKNSLSSIKIISAEYFPIIWKLFLPFIVITPSVIVYVPICITIRALFRSTE